MNYFSHIRFTQNTSRLLGIFLLALSSSVFAQVDEPWFSGPSILTLGNSATFNGANFTPGTVVRVQTEEQGVAANVIYVTVNEDGTISYEVAPSLEGRLTLSVFDSSDNKIASANGTVVKGE